MEAEWNEKIAKKLQDLSYLVLAQEVWKRCHDEMPNYAADYFEKVRGINKEWQDYLYLGYLPNYTVRNHLITYKDAAYTIPLYNMDALIENITLRVQSKMPEKRILKMLDFAEVVYIAFDPDAYVPEGNTKRIAVIETAKQIGIERVRLVMPPREMKFDDAILKGYNFANAVNMAIRPERITA
jgi:hypothetical protein